MASPIASTDLELQTRTMLQQTVDVGHEGEVCGKPVFGQPCATSASLLTPNRLRKFSSISRDPINRKHLFNKSSSVVTDERHVCDLPKRNKNKHRSNNSKLTALFTVPSPSCKAANATFAPSPRARSVRSFATSFTNTASRGTSHAKKCDAVSGLDSNTWPGACPKTATNSGVCSPNKASPFEANGCVAMACNLRNVPPSCKYETMANKSLCMEPIWSRPASAARREMWPTHLNNTKQLCKR